MLMNEADELLIQRCLDDELSPEETRQLLTRLNGISDGWKHLACGFLEERLLARGIRGRDAAGSAADVRSLTQASPAVPTAAQQLRPQLSQSPTEQTFVSPDQRRLQQMGYWWSHPVTSLSLCAAIAFVAGLLIRGQYPGQVDVANGLASTAAPVRSPAEQSASNGGTVSVGSSLPKSAAAASGMLASDFRVELLPADHGVGEPIELPVAGVLARDGDTMQVPQQFVQEMRRRYAGMPQPEWNGRLRAVRVPLNDQNDLLMLVEDHNFGPPPQ